MYDRYRVITTVALAVSAGLTHAALPSYKIDDLGFLPGKGPFTRPDDLNDNGVIVGYSTDDRFLWTVKKGLRSVGQLTSNDLLVINKINSRREGAGFQAYGGFTPNRAVFIDSNGRQNFFLDDTWAGGANFRSVVQETNSGLVMGTSVVCDGCTSIAPWVWSKADGFMSLPFDKSADMYVSRINDKGLIVGAYSIYSTSSDCYTYRAFAYELRSEKFYWLDGGNTADNTTAWCHMYSDASSVNSAGHVVGFSTLRPGEDATAPFVWTASQGYRRLPNADDPDMTGINPIDINDHDQIVGRFHSVGAKESRYFYWDAENGIADLQNLLDPNDPLASQVQLGEYDLTTPRINERGQIVVMGRLRSDGKGESNRTFLLTPIGAPSR